MKNRISYILGIFLFSTLIFSCENDMEKMMVTPENAPENVAVDRNTPLVCTADNAKDVALLSHGQKPILVKISPLPIRFNWMWQATTLPMHRRLWWATMFIRNP